MFHLFFCADYPLHPPGLIVINSFCLSLPYRDDNKKYSVNFLFFLSQPLSFTRSSPQSPYIHKENSHHNRRNISLQLFVCLTLVMFSETNKATAFTYNINNVKACERTRLPHIHNVQKYESFLKYQDYQKKNIKQYKTKRRTKHSSSAFSY